MACFSEILKIPKKRKKVEYEKMEKENKVILFDI